MGSEDVTLRGDETTFREPEVDVAPVCLDRLGRFVVLERLGVGGSGSVYRAYDSQLDRSVAIKVLHPGAATLRLLAEARAMAKLHHPNVVAVHDVGETDDGVWLAMEYVEGGTLRRWLDAQRRTHAEILSVFRRAGAGLAAAHVQGIVHRDFKPDNVLMHLSGRPAVTDFGLARPEPDDLRLRESASDSVDVTLRSGLAGTPAYMSPEQFEDNAVGPASDQFSFGVALFEALCRRRPFPGTTLPELCQQVVRGTFDFPADAAVPAWLRRALERMLQREPGDRFDSMSAAVEALDREPVRRRRRLLTGGAVVALTAGGLGVLSSGDSTPECDAGAQEAEAAWSAERRAEIEAAVARADLGKVADAVPPVLASLDTWAENWALAYDDACAATHVRGVQSDERLDARSQCLTAQREHVAAFSEELLEPDPAIVPRAFRAASELPKPSACASPSGPKAESEAEREAERWAVKAEVRNELGRYPQGLEAVDQGLAALGDSPSPLKVRLQVTEGQLARRNGDPERARAALERALRSHAQAPNPLFAAEGWLELSLLWAESLDKPDRALGTLLAAEVAVEALGDVGLQRRLESTRGTVLLYAERTDESVAAMERAVALAELDGSPLIIGLAQGNLGNALFEAGRYEDALVAYDAALAADSAAFPSDHPELILDHQNRSRALQALGRNEESEAELRGAIELAERAFGPDGERLGALHLNLGVSLIGSLQFEDARSHVQRAFDIWAKVHPPKHRYFDIADNNLGVIADEMGEPGTALRHYRASRERAAKREGPRSRRVAIALGNEANALYNMGRFDEAVALQRESLSIRLEVQTADHPDLAYALVGLARALIEVGDYDEAVEQAQRARAVREKSKVGPAQMYLTYITLAEALAASDEEKLDEARGWARAAAKAYEETGLPEDMATELRTFESERGLPENG